MEHCQSGILVAFFRPFHVAQRSGTYLLGSYSIVRARCRPDDQARPGWNDLLRPFLFGTSLFPLLLFFNKLLEIWQRFPVIHRFSRWLLTIYLTLFAMALLISSSRFSSLVHDNIGAHLGLLRLKADQMMLTESARRDVSGRIGTLADEVRRMSHRFSPLVLQDKGLQEALAEEVRFQQAETGIIFQYEWLGDASRLPHSYEIIIYRIVQELLLNVFKHAGASEVILQVISDGRQLAVYVEDNGRGDASRVGQKEGIGLRSIRELTEFLGGRCRIKTASGEGFSVSIELNIHDYADHKGGDRR